MSHPLSLGFSELLLASRLVAAGVRDRWTFEIAASSLPARRSFLIAAGLDQALALLADLEPDPDELAAFARGPARGLIDSEALLQLADLRFHGDVEAIPEGTVVFAGEPVVRVRAEAPEAVLVGSALVSMMRVQTAVATKAARLRLAAGGKPIYEVGLRATGREQSVIAARAAHVGGACATDSPLAATTYGLPTLPVVPLSLVAAIGGSLPGLELCGVLIDGALAQEGDSVLALLGHKPRALLIDATAASESANPDDAASFEGLTHLAKRVAGLRTGLESLGWSEVPLLVAGRIDEEQIEAIIGARVQIDGFAVGGELVVAADSPCVGFEWELVEREEGESRQSLPRRGGGAGARAVWRRREYGHFKGDVVQPENKAPPPGSMPLLVPMMRGGRRLFGAPSLAEVRVLCDAQISMLDPAITRRADPAAYPVVHVNDAPRKEAAAIAAAPVPLTVGEARAMINAWIDDSADFSAMNDTFSSVVAAQLQQPGDDERREAETNETGEAGVDEPGEATVKEPVAASAKEPVKAAVKAAVEARFDAPVKVPVKAAMNVPVVRHEPKAAVHAAPQPAGRVQPPLTPVHDPVRERMDATPDAGDDLGDTLFRYPAVESHDAGIDHHGMFEPPPEETRSETPVEPLEPDRDVAHLRPLAPTRVPEPVPVAAASPARPPQPVDPAAMNPLLAAAARLRSIQRGETPPRPGDSSLRPLESAPSVAAAVAPGTEVVEQVPSNPLLAAAARLKALRNRP